MRKSKTSVYIMTRDGWKDYFEMHVSTNANAMRMHAEAISKRDGWVVPSDGWAETQGMVHTIRSLEGPFAYLFLNDDGLGSGIVAHECLHIAMAHERFVIRFGMGYGEHIGEDEERLAYYLTSSIKGVYNTLFENKHIRVNT